jgi:hypothetical protein
MTVSEYRDDKSDLSPSSPELDALPTVGPGYDEKAASSTSSIVDLKLADRTTAYIGGYGPVTDALRDFFKLKTKAQRIKDRQALEDIATQPSVYDGAQAIHYQPRADWENIESFDPTFRWTWKEEKAAIWKVDWKVLSWVCVMFFALGGLLLLRLLVGVEADAEDHRH